KHIEIKEHQKAIEKYTRRQPDLLDIMSSFTIQTGVNKLDIIAKMYYVYLCAKKHIAIEVFFDLIELTNLQFQNKLELIYNKSPIIVSHPIFGPKRVFLDTISEPILNNQVSNYAIYNNSKAGADFLHAIAMVIEDILAEHVVENIPVLQYLELIELGETNAEAITNNLKNFFIAKMLNTQKLIHFGSDGA
ncbi:26780_t:CDS:2, partial [Racocetra persica]